MLWGSSNYSSLEKKNKISNNDNFDITLPFNWNPNLDYSNLVRFDNVLELKTYY